MKHIFPLFKPDKCLLSWEFPDYCLASSDWLSLIFPWVKLLKWPHYYFKLLLLHMDLKKDRHRVFNIKSRSHNDISGFLKINSYEMCAIGMTYFRRLDNSEYQLLPILKNLHNHVSAKGHIIHVTEIYDKGLYSLLSKNYTIKTVLHIYCWQMWWQKLHNVAFWNNFALVENKIILFGKFWIQDNRDGEGPWNVQCSWKKGSSLMCVGYIIRLLLLLLRIQCWQRTEGKSENQGGRGASNNVVGTICAPCWDS